jgi:hypothetical protein
MGDAVVLLLETAPAVARHATFFPSAVSTGDRRQTISAWPQVASRSARRVRPAAISPTRFAHTASFGFGGLARANDDGLPVPSELVLAQHARLGSTSAWLARSFFKPDADRIDVGAEVDALRARLAYWREQPACALVAEHQRLRCHLKTCRGH